MQRPTCRFCHADEDQQSVKGEHVYGGKDDQNFWKCEQCDIIYLYPPLTEDEEAHFYHEEFEKYMEKRAGGDMDWSGPEQHAKASQGEMIRRLEYLRPYIQFGKRVLEVGCSSGFMLSALKEQGMNVTGLDPSGGFLSYVRSKGINAFMNLNELKKGVKEPFDLICHFFVLEHIGHSVFFLNNYMSLLKSGGSMVFEVPCASDPLIELYKVPAFDRFYWSVAHHWYFNKKSLSLVLDKLNCSYRIIPEQRYDISNHMTWMMDGKPGGRERYSHILGKELDNLYKDKLKEHWLCDTMVAFIDKG